MVNTHLSSFNLCKIYASITKASYICGLQFLVTPTRHTSNTSTSMYYGMALKFFMTIIKFEFSRRLCLVVSFLKQCKEENEEISGTNVSHTAKQIFFKYHMCVNQSLVYEEHKIIKLIWYKVAK